MIDPVEVLALYDAQMRRDPIPDPGCRVERIGSIVRVVGTDNSVLFSDLTAADARRVVAEQVEFFRHGKAEVEWKVYGHDRPANLEAILAEAGFIPDEPETLVVFDLRDGIPEGNPPAGIEIRRVTGDSGIRDVVAANVAAFGSQGADSSTKYAERLKDPDQALYVAYAEEMPVASGRVVLSPGRSFASLWGGGTAPAHRHRGIYRSLVSARATLAVNSGYRFLTVDALATSLPILRTLGFVPLSTTRPWVLRPARDETSPTTV